MVRRRWLVVGLGGATVVGIVAGLMVWRNGDGERNGDRTASETSTTERPTTTRPVTTTTAPPTEWDSAVVELVRYVEQERGLRFTRPVAVVLLSDAGYVDSLGGEDDGTVGYYDGARIVVRGGELTPEVELTVVHELTHALQDQHFDIFALDERSETTREQQVAYSALLESDAFRVEAAYKQTLLDRGVDPSTLDGRPASSPPSSAEPGEPDEPDAGAPPTVGADGRGIRHRSSLGHLADRAGPQQRRPGLPYGWEIPSLTDAVDQAAHVTGGQLVEVLYQQGGNAAVDAAFRDPPQTTEQVLDPRVYLAHGGPVPVRRPAPRAAVGSVEPQTSVGALNLYLLLAAGVDPLQALDAVTGWGGESAVSYEDAADRVCIEVAAVGDTESDTAEIGAAFAAWATSGVAEDASTAQRRDGAHVLTACGLGAGRASTDPVQAMLLFQLRGIQARTAMRDGGLGIDAAFAFGDCVIRAMSIDTIVGVDVDAGPGPEAQAELEQAADACR